MSAPKARNLSKTHQFQGNTHFLENLNRRRPVVSAEGQKLAKNASFFAGVAYFLEILNRRRPLGSAERQKLTENAYFLGCRIFLGKFEPPEAAGQRRRPETCQKRNYFRGSHISSKF